MKHKIDPKLVKWISWSHEILREAQSLMIKTKLYDDYVEVVKTNKFIQSPDDFHQWTIRNYFDSALMSIRRLLDTHRDVISLIKLMEEIKCYHHLITKEFYLKDLPNGDGKLPVTRDFAAQWFDDNFSQDGLVVSQELVKNHITELKEQTAIVENFIDNTLAHKNEGRKGKQSISTAKVRQAIQSIEEITMKYMELLGQGSYVELTPTWQYDHLSIFTKAWIRKTKNEKTFAEQDLNQFLERVELIKQSSFITQHQLPNKHYSLKYTKDNGTKIETAPLPPRESLESFLIRIRPIIVKNERLYLEKVIKYVYSGNDHQKFLKERLELFERMKSTPFLLVSDNFEISSHDFINHLFYSEYLHTDTDKMQRVRNLDSAFGEVTYLTALRMLQSIAKLAFLIADDVTYIRSQVIDK